MKEVLQIDIKDRKILFELSINPRASLSYLAKKVKLSRETVSYRLNSLKQKGIYLGTFLVVNPKVFNFRKHVVLLKLKGVHVETDFINKIKTIPNIISVLSCGGKWDVILIVLTKDLDVLYECISQVKRKLKSHVMDFVINPVLFEKFLHLGYLVKEEQDVNIIEKLRKSDANFLNPVMKIKKTNNKIDEIDFKIIEELEKDASSSVSNISNKLNLAHNTIANRMKKLEDMGVFSSIFPVVNEPLIGLEWYDVFLRMDFLDEKKERSFLTYIVSHPFMIYYMKMIGNYNYKITLASKNTTHLNKIITGIKEKFSENIEEYEPLIIFKRFSVSSLSEIKKKDLNM